MPLPYKFLSGEIARSAEVNANFDYLMEAIGASAGSGTLNPYKLTLGPRSNSFLIATHDVGGYETDFVQLSWNANLTKEGTVWKFARVLPSVGASALRVGVRGLELFATEARVGDMHGQMKLLMRVDTDDAGMFTYTPDGMYMSRTEGVPNALSHHRNTVVFFEGPVPIYQNQWVGSGTSILNAMNYGVPRHATAILINAHVTAAPNSGAGMHFYQYNGGGSNIYHGLVVHATITGSGMGMRTGAQGMVPLGRGANVGSFAVYRTSSFELANVFIIGYLT